jgi:diguanylate cyclase (GGDEF)-like protein/PAS domain S-box-containing protein
VADLIRRLQGRTLKTPAAAADLRVVDAARVMSAGASPLDLDARRRRLMARGSAASFAGTGVLALVSSLAGGDFGVGGWVVVAVAVAAGLLGTVVLFASASLGRVGTHAIVVLGALLMGVVVGVERPSYGLLYVWLAFFVASFFRPRAVALHVGWMLVCAGFAMSLGDPLQRPLESWLLLAGTLAGTSAFVCVVRRHLLDLAARERESRAFLDQLLEDAPLDFAFVDRDLVYRRINRRALDSTQRPAETILGRTVAEAYPELVDQIEPALRSVLATGEPIVATHMRTDSPSAGGERHWLVSRFPVRAADGTIIGVSSMRTDITDLKRAEARLAELLASEQQARADVEEARRILDERNRELAEQARIDSLTRLANRPAFFEHAEEALARAREAGSTVAVLYVDLDNFKQINDTLGHAAGDELLGLVARRLHSLARATDLVARVGGDEFLLLLTDLDGKQGVTRAAAVADRAREVLTRPFAVGDAIVRVTASVGVGMSAADAFDADTLVAAADAAMYSAKRTARRDSLRSVS